MKSLIFIKNSKTTYNGKEYVISQFLDVYNLKVLYGTDLPNHDKLIKGQEYKCDLDVSYNTQKKEYKFKVITVK